MHVVYVIVGINLILDKITKRRRLKNYILILFLINFAIFTGGSSSCIRACIMACTSILAQNLYRKNDSITVFFLALDIVLILNPYNLESVGMWLSFLGTFGLMKSNIVFEKCKSLFLKFHMHKKQEKILEKYILENLKNNSIKEKLKNYILENLKNSFAVNLMIFPVILIVYNTISLTFFISNFFISFLIGPVLILGYISLFLGGFIKIINFLESILLNILFSIAKIIGNIPISKIYLPSPNIIFFVLYYIFIIILIYLKENEIIFLIKKVQRFIRKNIAIIIVIFMVILLLFRISKNHIELDFLDVGQRRL
jgi:competence protein ComEC